MKTEDPAQVDQIRELEENEVRIGARVRSAQKELRQVRSKLKKARKDTLWTEDWYGPVL